MFKRTFPALKHRMPSQTIVGKFMPCPLTTTNCFQTVLMTILFQSAQFIPIPQDYQPLTICFYLEFTLPQENAPLHLLAQKYGFQYQTILSLQPLLLLNGNS